MLETVSQKAGHIFLYQDGTLASSPQDLKGTAHSLLTNILSLNNFYQGY